MCGIVGVFDIKEDQTVLRKQVLKMAKKIRHRGPDWSGIYCDNHVVLAHERLAIVDPKSGSQPLISQDGNIILAVNGEIYNHKELREALSSEFSFQTESDCEVLIALYLEKGVDFIKELNGIFAFTLYDKRDHSYLIVRDHMGIIPLYHGWDEQGQYYVGSELKALEGVCKKIESFPPGHYYSSKEEVVKAWYTKEWELYENVKDNTTSIDQIRKGLEEAVHRQLMSDVPYGVLLSGGLDSSVISAIVKKYADKRVESGGKTGAWWPQLHSFSVGLEGSPDLKYAQIVAEHIGTVHHEIHFSIQEGLDAVRDVIYHLETYDVTTIRAATPMYLLSRVIKSMGIKMVLSGEGADELFGGYLYFHKAPSPKAFHEETVSKLDKLHLYDCNRANKALAAWGVEGRVPFLDKKFIEVAMNVNPADKMITGEKMEKWVLRKAFEDYLPESVVWRQKEQFSDGVGYSWIDSLKELVERSVPDELMDAKQFRFVVNPPQNKEEYYYRSIFEEHFPSEAASMTVPSLASVACSTPAALEWDESFKNMNEPSGRAVAQVHAQSYSKAAKEQVK